MARRHPLILFFALAYAWVWLVFIPMVVFHASLAWRVLATLGPTVAAIVTHRITTGSYRADRVYTTGLRTLGATAIGVAIVILAYVVLPAIVTADPRALHCGVRSMRGTRHRNPSSCA
jgi:hypothetical protein